MASLFKKSLYTAGLTGLAALSLKYASTKSDQVITEEQNIKAAPTLVIPSLKHTKWESYQTTNHNNPEQTINCVGVQVNSQTVNLLAGAHLICMRQHAAKSGHNIFPTAEYIADSKIFLRLEAQSAKAKEWLDTNAGCYGFKAAFDHEAKIIANLYQFNPLHNKELSLEVLQLQDRFSQVLTTNLSGYEAPKITIAEFREESSALLALGIMPKMQGDQVSLNFDFTKYSDVINSLHSLGSRSIDLVPLKRSIYNTVKSYYPDISEQDQNKILSNVLKLNNALFDLDPQRIKPGTYIAIPILERTFDPADYSIPKESATTKASTNTPIKTLCPKELESCKQVAIEYKVFGKEAVSGIVTYRLESSLEGSLAIARIEGDPGAASYGRCQLSSAKGSLAHFINFCLADKKFNSIGSSLKKAGGLSGKKIPASFDKTWISTVKANPTLFYQAESSFIKQTIELPSISRAKEHNLDTESLAIRAFLYSLATQYGIPDKNANAKQSMHKFDEICREGRCPSGDNLSTLEKLLKKRSSVMLRMADYQISIKKPKTAEVYRSIVKHRYVDEAKLLKWLHAVDLSEKS